MKMRNVTKEEFDDFLAGYGKPLQIDVVMFCEPPCRQYNDFSSGKVWPESVVASVVLNESYSFSPNEYLIAAVPPSSELLPKSAGKPDSMCES